MEDKPIFERSNTVVDISLTIKFSIYVSRFDRYIWTTELQLSYNDLLLIRTTL